MRPSRANIRQPSENLNECPHEEGEHQECSNIARQSQQDIEELLLGQVSALESTFNEAMESNHPLQTHSNFIREEFEEATPGRDNRIEGVDQNLGKNCSEVPSSHEKERLQGKRTPSSRGIDGNSDGGTSVKRSRSLSPVTS
jgi:hypothetical protein